MGSMTFRFRVPEDPRLLTILLDDFRVRLLRYTDILDISVLEIQSVEADYSALSQTMRGHAAAEAVAWDWRLFEIRLMGVEGQRTEEPGAGCKLSSPTTTAPPPASRAMRPAIVPRLQTLIDRISAHPDFTREIARDLGIFIDADVHFTRPQR
jgi:hypothetical protein